LETAWEVRAARKRPREVPLRTIPLLAMSNIFAWYGYLK